MGGEREDIRAEGVNVRKRGVGVKREGGRRGEGCKDEEERVEDRF